MVVLLVPSHHSPAVPRDVAVRHEKLGGSDYYSKFNGQATEACADF